jgi:NAD(P)-dependent dehydrogenase (short-subunit alcohol dehydrogenase family)
VARIFITGRTDGLGRAAARALIDEGHGVVRHARSRQRASAVDDLASRSEGVVLGDLGSAVETHSVAEQVNDIDWIDRRWNSRQAYSDSKLYVTALAFAVARCWLEVLSNAVDPGWVATKMGGPGAPDDFEKGYLTQTWLVAGDDPAATVTVGYWHHRRLEAPAKEASDLRFQDQLSAKLAELTGVPLF